MEETWAPGGGGRAPAGPSMHHHYIVGSWLAPKVGCDDSTCQVLVQKAVPRSVDALQVYDDGPMDPRQVNLGHCLN